MEIKVKEEDLRVVALTVAKRNLEGAFAERQKRLYLKLLRTTNALYADLVRQEAMQGNEREVFAIIDDLDEDLLKIMVAFTFDVIGGGFNFYQALNMKLTIQDDENDPPVPAPIKVWEMVAKMDH